MILSELVKVLAANRVKLTMENGQLSVNAPKGSLTPDIVAQLKAHKAELIQYLQESDGRNQRIPRVDRNAPLHLSYVQQRLWLLDQIGSGTSYNMACALKLSGALDLAALTKAFETILDRHESLRSCFTINEDGQPLQIIQADVPFSIPVVNLTLLEEGARQLHLSQLLVDEMNHAFDLARDLMLRSTLIQMAGDEHVLIVTMHHIASDGWSLGILINEVCELYSAYSSGQANPLKALSIQYADYAQWQRQLLADQQENELLFWKKELADAPQSTPLPVDYFNPAVTTNTLGVASINVNSLTLDTFKHVMQKNKGTLFSGLFAALNLLLHHWCKENTFVIGVVDAGRDHSATQGLIGCFINTFAVRTDIKADERLSSCISRICEHLNEVMSHKAFPFDLVVNAINPDRNENANPLFNVGLLLQNFSMPAVKLAGLDVSQMELDRAEALLDLRFVISESADGLVLSCDYRQELFSGDTIELLLAGYRAVIEHITAQVDLKVAELEVPAALIRQASNARQRQYTVCAAGTFTLEPLADSFYFWRDTLALDITLQITPFQQVFQQLLDGNSELRRNQNGFNLLLLSLQDWLGTGSVVQQQANLEDAITRFCSALAEAQAQSSILFVVMLCPADIQVCGDAGLLKKIHELQQQVYSKFQHTARVQVVLPEILEHDFPLQHYFDFQSFQLGHIPYTPEYYSALAARALREFNGHYQKPYKVIVLDCDNTLWQGVCAEDGPAGVRVSADYHYLQQFVLRLQEQGFLLCLCSANEPEDVWSVFAHNQDMLIKREKIIGSRINWEPKWKNIQSLANELNLGLDSIIFIDDDALQCAQMREFCPQVATLQLPAAPADIPAFLNNFWAFDNNTSPALPADRTTLYEQHGQREQLAKTYRNNQQEYLDSLGLTIDIQSLTSVDCARAAELLVRTNQFNVSGVVIDEESLVNGLDGNSFGISARVDDRFGAYGLVGLVIFVIEDDSLRIVNMVLSCRALGRGVEYEMLKAVGRVAHEQNLSRIALPFIRTARNTPAFKFLGQLHNVIPQDFAPVTIENKTHHLFSVADVLTLDYRKMLHLEDSISPLPEQPLIESLANAGQIIKPQQYHIIAEALRSFTLLQENIQANMQQRLLTTAVVKQEYVAPDTEIEKKLCDIFQAILGVENIGIHDNFFQMGGNSLLAVKLLTNIEKEFNLKISIKNIFVLNTVFSMAEHIAALTATFSADNKIHGLEFFEI